MISSQSKHSVRTVRIHRSASAFALGACTGVTSTWGTLRSEAVVEPAGELRVPVAHQEPEPQSPPLQHQEQVAGLLGDPVAVGVGSQPGQMNPASFQLDEAQHLQPPQPDGVDGEQVTPQDSRCLLAEERPPGGGGRPQRRVQPVSAQRRSDCGCRDPHPEAQPLAWMRWSPQRGFSWARRTMSGCT
jgi:hypothetical protein